ncbi:MAG: CvpA family protein [Thermoguttaceae bacterium]|nr:CvpA family protein [Thermoguttaceae bacterium]
MIGFYDLIVLILVAVFAWRGYQKGLVSQVGALITVIVVGSISVLYAPTLSDYMPGSGNISFAIAFIIIVLLATAVVWNIVNALSKLVTKLKLKAWNNQMGAFLGLINGIFVSMILTFCLLVFAVPRPVKNNDGTYTSVTYDRNNSFVLNSFLGPYLTSATLTTINNLPCGKTQFYNNLREKLQAQANDIKAKNPNLPQNNNSQLPNGYDAVNQAPPQGPQPGQQGFNPPAPGYNQQGQGGYNRPTPGYDQQGQGGYNQPAPGYDQQGQGGYNQPAQGYDQQNPSGYNYPANGYDQQDQDGYYPGYHQPGYGGGYSEPYDSNRGYNGRGSGYNGRGSY